MHSGMTPEQLFSTKEKLAYTQHTHTCLCALNMSTSTILESIPLVLKMVKDSWLKTVISLARQL